MNRSFHIENKEFKYLFTDSSYLILIGNGNMCNNEDKIKGLIYYSFDFVFILT